MKQHRLILLVTAFVLSYSSQLLAVTWQWDGGAATGNWQTNSNWNPDTGNPNFNNTFADRLNVNGAQELIYSAAEGTTVYGTAGLRGVVIGSGALGVGQMRITGGSFSTINATGAGAEDVIANSTSAGTSSLIIDGGNFISNVISVGFGGAVGNTGILTLTANGGTATINELRSATSTTGIVNLDGGTLTVNLVTAGPGNETLNLNGGTYRAGANTAGFSGLNRANVRNGGAVINTNTFTITVAQPLLHSDILGDNATDGGLTKSGTGSLTLTGVNDYTGLTTVNTGGQLVVGNNSALGTTANGTTVASGSRVVLSNGITVTGEEITIAGNGNTGGADTTNFFGALQAGASATATWTGIVNLGTNARAGAQTGGSLTLSGIIQNGASSHLEISGGGGAGGTISGGVVIVSGTGNLYSGNTNIVRGILRIGADNALPVGTILDVDFANAAESATFDLNNFNQTVATLRRTSTGGGAGNSFVTNTGGAIRTLTVNQGSNTTYSGKMTGNLGLTKSGVGNLTLTGVSGANDYVGPTSVLAGMLTLSGSGNLTGTSAISIATGAELDTTALSYIMSGSQPFTFDVDGAGAGSAGLLDATALNITSGLVTFNVVSALDDPAYVFANYTSLTGVTFASAPAPSGYFIDYNYLGGNQIALVQIPEPSSLAMLAFGMLSLWLFRRR